MRVLSIQGGEGAKHAKYQKQDYSSLPADSEIEKGRKIESAQLSGFSYLLTSTFYSKHKNNNAISVQCFSVMAKLNVVLKFNSDNFSCSKEQTDLFCCPDTIYLCSMVPL